MAKKKVPGNDEWKYVLTVARASLKEANKRIDLLNEILSFKTVPSKAELKKIDAKIDKVFYDEELYFATADVWVAFETAEFEARNSDVVANNN